MKKLILAAILLSATIAQAQCVITKLTIGYFDPVRFLAIDRVFAASEEQGFMMVKKDIADGKAVVVKPGTKLENVTKHNEYISFADIGSYRIVIFNEHMRCGKNDR